MRLCKKAPHDNLNLTERQHIHSLRLNFYLAAAAPHIYRLHAAPGSAAWHGMAAPAPAAPPWWCPAGSARALWVRGCPMRLPAMARLSNRLAGHYCPVRHPGRDCRLAVGVLSTMRSDKSCPNMLKGPLQLAARKFSVPIWFAITEDSWCRSQ